MKFLKLTRKSSKDTILVNPAAINYIEVDEHGTTTIWFSDTEDPSIFVTENLGAIQYALEMLSE